MIFKVEKRARRLLNCNELIELKGEGNYIVNDELKTYIGPCKNVDAAIRCIFSIVKTKRICTNAASLILNSSTRLSKKVDTLYTRFTLSGNLAYKVPYFTKESLDDLRKCGAYCIINESLKIIYIGETITSFHDRWTQHCNSTSLKVNELITTNGTIFKILKICDPDKDITEYLEAKFIDYYKNNSDYTVLGGAFSSYLHQ